MCVCVCAIFVTYKKLKWRDYYINILSQIYCNINESTIPPFSLYFHAVLPSFQTLFNTVFVHKKAAKMAVKQFYKKTVETPCNVNRLQIEY